MVLVGDFNYPGIDWNNLTATRIQEKQFLESVCDNFLCQHVEEATRIQIGQSPNMLDLIFSNEEGMICNVNYLPGLSRSDHICLLFQLNLYSTSKKESFRFPKGDYEAMNLAINNQQWDMIRNSPNVNKAWDNFHSTILNLMNIHIPKSRTRHNKKKNPWMTREGSGSGLYSGGLTWSIVLRCDDHTGIFTCDGCARDPYFYVPSETQSYVIKLSCSRKVASGD